MTTIPRVSWPALLTVAALAAACGPSPTQGRPGATAADSAGGQGHYAALVAARDRSDRDRALDAGRKPVETLTFLGVEPGMRVAEIAAGGGYTTELLARAVGTEGEVFGVNSAFVLDRFAEAPWSARLEKPVMAPVTRLDREFDDPFPEGLGDLDLVVNVLFYHDTFWMEGLDRDAMNRAIFAALRPGGRYVVIDHSAADPMSADQVKTLHRVGEQRVREEIEAAGFELSREANFLRNPDDARDWSASPSAAGERRGHSDRFVLEFVKPVTAPAG